ncbi:MAG: hypothetical protein HY720_04870 [Planctomycetes bacterium]|nr:hypothetical protein [Planctomycetota bacterium]
MIRSRPSAALLLLMGLSGCQQPVPYEPDREVVRSIPREQAKSELARLLGRALPSNPAWGDPEPLQVVEVGDAGFAFRWKKGHETPEFRADYASLAPRAFRSHIGRENVYVSLRGKDAGPNPGAGDGAIWFASQADAEMMIDAVESLKAAGQP